MKAELEALLATSWTRETFATYADALQAENDPRGEWIALELSMLRDGVKPAIQQRRDKLVRRYKLYDADTAYGFIENLNMHAGRNTGPKRLLEVTLAGVANPLATYLRRLDLREAPARIIAVLEALAASPRPWLYELALDPGDDFRAPAIPNALMRRVLDQCPRLESIAIGGATALQIFGDVSRPGLSIGPHVSRELGRFVRFAIPTLGTEELELTRLDRLHGGTVDEMSDPTRDAWAELRWRIDCARHDPRARAPQPFPLPLLARIVRDIDKTSYYGTDWAGLAGKLEHATEVSVGF